MEVIPVIMTEEMVEHVPVSVLRALAGCASEPILDKIKTYLENDDADKKAKTKIYRCFVDTFSTAELNINEDLITRAKELEELDKATLVFEAEVEYLERILENIELIIGNKDIDSYIAPTSNTEIKDIITDLKMLYSVSSGDTKTQLKELHDNLKLCSRLFKDSGRRRYKVTPYSRVLYREQELKIVEMGIKNILKKKAEGANPSTWRYI